jgi:hypothetical protein
MSAGPTTRPTGSVARSWARRASRSSRAKFGGGPPRAIGVAGGQDDLGPFGAGLAGGARTPRPADYEKYGPVHYAR